MSAIPDTMQALVLKYDGYSGTAEGPTIEKEAKLPEKK